MFAVPCTVLLAHFASQNMKNGRVHHGCIQLSVFVMHFAAWLLARGPFGSPALAQVGLWCRSATTCFWLLIEVCLAKRLSSRRRRSIYRIRESSSQVMWCASLIGETALIVYDRLQAAEGMRPNRLIPTSGISSSWSDSYRRCAEYVVGLLPSLRASSEMPVDMLGQLQGNQGGSLQAIENLAFILAVICFMAIHAPVFAEFIHQARRAWSQTFLHIDSTQIVFYDRPGQWSF